MLTTPRNEIPGARSLVETFSKRLAVSEDVYAGQHQGAKMSNFKKVTVAKLLENTNRFLNEAFGANSIGTQQADMKAYKKFCLNLVTVAIPNLIAPELVAVYPMSSITGYITYVEYVAGTNKGATSQGDLFNSPLKLGNVDVEYTSDAVTEPWPSTNFAWTPCVQGVFKKADGTILGDVMVNQSGTKYYGTFASASAAEAGTIAGMTWVDADGTSASPTITSADHAAYRYNNIDIPQKDVPILNARMQGITLQAKARRIAVYYSQIAAFQTKNDYGFDLGDQLAEKAVGQLNYEIDTEVIDKLDETAGTEAAGLVWSKTLPIGVSKVEHYTGFLELLEDAKALIYDKTKRFVPNYMIIHSSIKPVLSLIPGWNEVPNSTVNGPYFAGTISGLKVYVSPAIDKGRYLIGVNGDDYAASVAVYAPYMPVVPTQLMQYNDGGTTQGFSTMYDLQVLNPDLIVAGKVTA